MFSKKIFENVILTFYNINSNFRISISKGIKYPPTAGIKNCVCNILIIGIGSKTMRPQAQLFKLCPIKPRVALQPVWCGEGQGDKDNHNDQHPKGTFSRQWPVPVDVSVRQNIVLDAHFELKTFVLYKITNHISKRLFSFVEFSVLMWRDEIQPYGLKECFSITFLKNKSSLFWMVYILKNFKLP